MNNNESLQIGDRIISDDSYFGIVRYIGEVEGYQGNWYGIEWDSQSRGKHRGNVKGKQYFDCEYDDSSASFMKIEKLMFGSRQSFMQSIVLKFTEKIGNYNDLYVNTNLNNRVPIEMVGMEMTRERQQQFQLQRDMPANQLMISDIDEHPIIYNSFNNLVELNLSNNLLCKWTQIFKLLNQLPNLCKLILNGNRLDFNLQELNNINISKIKLENLVLIDMKMKWQDTIQLCKYYFKNLKVLKLGKNNIKELSNCNEDLNEIFPQLLQLDLSFNEFTSFTSIFPTIGILNKLTELNLNNNLISSINTFNLLDENDKLLVFRQLQHIYLSDNQINSWLEIENLDSFKSIVELSFRNNPIQSSYPTTKQLTPDEIIIFNRENIIPRISSLLKLNLTPITLIERKDCERNFIYENFNLNPDFNSKKLKELVKIHGEPNPK